jgi:hypothetical protein
MKDITGQKFGRLTALELSNDKKTHKLMWVCKCSCGKIVKIRSSSLTTGNTKSCGCLKFYLQKMKKIQWKEVDAGDHYLIPVSTTGFCKIDKEDLDVAKKYNWSLSHGYVESSSLNTSNPKDIKKTSMHRLIMNTPRMMHTDHINFDKTDNRKSNLRICSARENTSHLKISSKNTSGFTGVYWDKNSKKWFAKIKHIGKQLHLGTYKNKEDAIKIRRCLARILFGAFNNEQL